jgi:hypothetical protein
MQIATTTAQWVVRLTGATQVALGLLFWNGRALTLVPVHMMVGLGFVLGLWVLAGLAARAGVRPGLVLVAALWGIAVLALGITQGRLLPGPAHWVVAVLHLLVGFAAMALAALLAAQIGKRQAATLAPESNLLEGCTQCPS